MSISSIQASEAQYEISAPKRLNTSEDSGQGGSGSDKVSISEEAFRLAREAATDKENREKDAQSFMEDEKNKQPKKQPLELGNINMMTIMMELLLAAELEKTGDTANDTNPETMEEQPKQAKSANPFQDTEKVAALKKVMADMRTGKVDTSDILQAMAGGKSAGTIKSTGSQTNITQSTASDNKENKLSETLI